MRANNNLRPETEISDLHRRIARLRKRIVFNLGHNAQDIARQIWERKLRIRQLEELIELEKKDDYAV